MDKHLAAAFLCGLVIGGSLAALWIGARLSLLRARYPHFDAAFELIDKMRERGL